MSEKKQPQKRPSRKKNTEPLKPVLIIFILILLVIGGGLFFFSGQEEPLKPVDTLPPVDSKLTDSPAAIQTGQEKEITNADLPDQEPQQPKTPKFNVNNDIAAVPEQDTETPEETRAKECRILAEQVHGFFTHVDSEDYIKNFELKEPSQTYFISLAYKLLKNPPVVSRESDDLYTILKNMAHFFRVIGKDNIILIKTIMDRERDKIEDVAAELYQWTSWNTCEEDLLQFSPALVEMYEYAGFFLNTMGGRSYLFRRDSRSRLLVNYYSILLIERANQLGINRHGIDITQITPQLIQEIESSNQLIYKENYIDSLYNLLEKYQ